MNGTIFETHTDERGNVSVRVSQEVQVLTLEEADRIAAEYKRMQADNFKLRERVAELEELLPDSGRWYRAETVEAYVAEIAKLRELVSGLEYCVRTSVCDCCCPLYDSSSTNHRRCESLERELGIEVQV